MLLIALDVTVAGTSGSRLRRAVVRGRLAPGPVDTPAPSRGYQPPFQVDDAVRTVVIIGRDVSVGWQLCAQRRRRPLLPDEDTAATPPQAAAPDSLTRARGLLLRAGIGLHADLSGVCTKFRVRRGRRFCRCHRVRCRSMFR